MAPEVAFARAGDVAHGRAPEVYACGFCHTPGGQGRPENASLAGLPASYIVQDAPRASPGTRACAARTRRGMGICSNPGGGHEPLGTRLLEFAPDAGRHENRDDDMVYLAYVPPGSLRRGKALADTGASGPATACVACHGSTLQGVGLVPRLAGRSPTYLLRQLLAFKTGARAGAAGQPMVEVAAKLDLGAMIDAAAYAASLNR